MVSQHLSGSGEGRVRKRAGPSADRRFPDLVFPDKPDLSDSRLYVNRELSLLLFQRRVLEEAQDEENPLLERFKFLSIVGSNLDEFFMVRVAGLKRQVESGNIKPGPDGLSPLAQLQATRLEVTDLLRSAHYCLRYELMPALKAGGVHVLKYEELSASQREVVQEYFLESIFPVLTPLAVDPGHPFPHISNLSLNLAVHIEDRRGRVHFARLKVPDSLPQLVSVDSPSRSSVLSSISVDQQSFIWLDDLVSANLSYLFPGMEVVEAHPFHVTRDAEVEVQEWEAGDLLETTEEGIRQRRFGDVVRLMVDYRMPSRILDILVSNLEITPDDVYRVDGRIPLSSLKHVHSLDRQDLKYRPFLPSIPAVLDPDAQTDHDIFGAIRAGDILLHHPYDSFQPVVNFLRQAARDPGVLAIKMTLYRIGQNSPVVEALLEAVENRKQVAVLVELKARFDEESNIEWAKALEREGVHVVYGLLGLKVHSKVALVVRAEGGVIRRYVHLGTGNYNPVTAHLYTDLGLLTCDEALGSDATDLFNYLTGYSAKTDYLKQLVAPINLRRHFEELIEREIEHQRQGDGGHLIFQMNSLVDERIIRLLYEASRAGVKVDLIVRGMCCLRPGIPGVSDNVRVVSVVGRFLEHSRIYYFKNGGREEIYLGSADLMPRNLDRRVEALFPVEDPRLKKSILDDVLRIYLADNLKARLMSADGSYRRLNPETGQAPLSCQELFLSEGSLQKRAG